MNSFVEKLKLERTGPAEATVGMISLPLPRDVASQVTIDHAASALQPIAWWKRHEVPRRSLAFVVDANGVPETLGLREGAPQTHRNVADAPAPWTVSTRITK